ncbi:MAG: glycosyltransferase, partial [Microgenomates group bacterium]
MYKKKLKILIVAPTNFKVVDHNTLNSGSIEQHTYLLSEALAKRGHEVTLFSTKDSGCPKGVKLAYTFKTTPRNYYKLDKTQVFARDFIQVTSALKNSKKYDYVSCHAISSIATVELLKSQGVPVVGSTTMHWRTNDPRVEPLLLQYPKHPLIVISRHANKILIKKNNILGIVHHGLKINQWKYSDKKSKYLLFVGKLIPEKGVDIAVQVAKKTGLSLLIAGRIMEERYPGFFKEKIKPYLNDKIKYLGEVTGKNKVNLFKNAFCFLGPGRWAEPFGIVFIESQACGTPVIAWNPGSSNDSIIQGKTGFIIKAKNDNEAIERIIKAVKMIPKISSANCLENVKNEYL